MRTIEYNNAAYTMRFEIPPTWAIDSITEITIQIADMGATELLAATATTLYTATTLDAAATVGDSTITLASEASAVVPGDVLHIAASAAGPDEDTTVQSYNSSTRVVTLQRELRYAHSSGTAVRGLWVTYDLDTSTVATWIKGLQVLITWDPDTDDIPMTNSSEVVVKAVSFPNFNERFRINYPGEYDAFVDTLEQKLVEAVKQIQPTLLSRGIVLDRSTDTESLTPLLCASVRRMIMYASGDKKETEREVANSEYNRLLDEYCKSVIWSDDDQDGIQDDDEVDDHSPWQLLNSERGI